MESPAGMGAGGTAWADLGFCVLQFGQVDSASEFFQKGLTIPTTQMLMNKPRFLLGSALVALARQQLDEATRLVMEARQYVEERSMKYFYPAVAITEAQISLARGNFDNALAQFKNTEVLAQSMLMRPAIWQARAGAAQALSALGRSDEAAELQHDALAMIDEIAGLFSDDTLRTLYLKNVTCKIGLPSQLS
jgi:ATP/maltotriose-dependent transcriptional regulator MalT